ncbi:MAG: 4Fe-4S dicluster domain-containing protein [Candidatus Edwardsbacteria bacterium]
MKILKKENIKEFINQLFKEGLVFAPTGAENEDNFFTLIDSAEQLCLNYINGFLGPKRLFFPQLQSLFSYTKVGALNLTPLLPAKKIFLFGIRSCDLSAILYYDKFFGAGKFSDIYYQKQRELTTTISIGCNQPGPKCFCVCTDTGPYLENGFDLQLGDLDDRFLVEIGSEKGKDLVDLFGGLFSEAKKSDLEEKEKRAREAENKFPKEPTSYFSKAIRLMDQGKLSEEFWAEVANSCFGCGGCIYVCPMCSCFDVMDRNTSAREGLRMRCWDTCDFAGFTREVSGHNPRSEKKDQRKRWFYHKLSCDYLEINEVIGCVGCGRCVITCPGEIDMPAVVKMMRRGGKLK